MIFVVFPASIDINFLEDYTYQVTYEHKLKLDSFTDLANLVLTLYEHKWTPEYNYSFVETYKNNTLELAFTPLATDMNIVVR
jgi:hypothetical protein